MSARYLTAEQVAERIGMDVDYVRRQCHAGEIRAKKLGTQWRIAEDAVVEFMAPGRAKPTRIRSTSSRGRRRAAGRSLA